MEELLDAGDLDRQYCHVKTSEMVAFVSKHDSKDSAFGKMH